MPRDRIERAIKKATGGGDATDYAEVRYEGYGPAGVAVIVEALTDHPHRTAAEVRAAFSRRGGAPGDTNSLALVFARVGPAASPAGAGCAGDISPAPAGRRRPAASRSTHGCQSQSTGRHP